MRLLAYLAWMFSPVNHYERRVRRRVVVGWHGKRFRCWSLRFVRVAFEAQCYAEARRHARELRWCLREAELMDAALERSRAVSERARLFLASHARPLEQADDLWGFGA